MLKKSAKRIVNGIIIIGIFTTSALALATENEPACVKAYRENSESIHISDNKSYAGDPNEAYLANWGAKLTTGASVVCVLITKGKIKSCLVTIVPAMAFWGADYYMESNLNTVRDAARFWMVYQDIVAGKTRENSHPIDQLLGEVAVPPDREALVLKTARQMLEEGNLCSGSTPNISWHQLVSDLATAAYN